MTRKPATPKHDHTRRDVVKRLGNTLLGAAVASQWIPDTSRGATVSSGTTKDFADLSARVSGPVVPRNTPHYEAWRQSMMWQMRKSPRRPDAIVQAHSVEDVSAAINFAREHGLRVTTRAGGHSMSASFLRDDGLLVDVSRFQDIQVNAAAKRASVGPGVIGRGLNERLAAEGLAFPTAHCGMVPISGFLLGGGVGWNGNQWGGLSTFNIEAVDIVTADGRARTASPAENPDLYWAVRGGGPGLFGVVTRFELKVYERPKTIYGDTYIFKFSDLTDVVTTLAELGPKADKDVEFLGVVTTAPPELAGDCSAPACDQVVYLSAYAFTSSEQEGRRKLRAVAEHPLIKRAIGTHLGELSNFESLYFNNELPFSQRRWAADNIFTNRIRDVAEVLKRHIPAAPSKICAAVFVYKGNPRLPDAACSTIGDFYSSYYMLWDDPADDLIMRRYHVGLFKELRPLGVGSNINEMNQEGRPEDVKYCYSPRAWQRLAELRRKWDPQGVFQPFYGQS